LLHPDQTVLGAVHDHTVGARVCKNCCRRTPLQVEARGLLEQNMDISRALVAELSEKGTLLTNEIDAIISTRGRALAGKGTPAS
jgi:hypothetical protein